MTRLTNEMRDNIRIRIMNGLPNIDYLSQINTLLQDTIIAFAPTQVQEIYADEKTRGYLRKANLEVNANWGAKDYKYFECVYGLIGISRINMDERVETLLKEGTLIHAIYFRLRGSRLIEKYREQEELRADVVKRLKANLAAASTVKRLFTVLEPELHGYIPVIVERKSNLPSCIAPVADDLRKLGANLPQKMVK